MKHITYLFICLLFVLSSCDECELLRTSTNLAGAWDLTETTQILTCESDHSFDTTFIFNDTLSTVCTLKQDGSCFVNFGADTAIVGTWAVNSRKLNVDAKYVHFDLLWSREYTIQKLTSKQLILNNRRDILMRESAHAIPITLLMNETTKFIKQ